MRKWMDKAARDDPNAWYSVLRMWPTKRGTYESSDKSAGTSKTAAGAGSVIYAFAGRTLTGEREYVVDTTHIWQYSSGSLTDRTNGVTVGSAGKPMMCQYGNITICVMGAANPTVYSSGTTFSALAGAPQGEIIVTQSNCVLIFNTSTNADGWAASDTGDYTNWSTGTAESGRIIQTPGPIRGAVAYGNDVYVFKDSAIYRMTYTISGWTVKLAWTGIGLANAATYNDHITKYQVVATQSGIAFCGTLEEEASASNPPAGVYLFDGVSRPVELNPYTTISAAYHVFLYHPLEDVLVLACSRGVNLINAPSEDGVTYYNYYYSFVVDAWGTGGGNNSEDFEDGGSVDSTANGVLQGDFYARAEQSLKPVYWRYRNVTTGAIYRNAPTQTLTGQTSVIISTAYGSPGQKTLYNRVTPILRRRTDAGADTSTLNIETYRERHNIFVSASQSLLGIAESTQRNRFDFQVSDNYAAFSLTFNENDVEIDDIVVTMKPAGTD